MSLATTFPNTLKIVTGGVISTLLVAACAGPRSPDAPPPPTTGCQTPEEVMRRFMAGFSPEHLDDVIALYEENAVFAIPGSGTVARGRKAIREALAGMLAMHPELHSQVAEVHIAGDTAVVINVWTMTAVGPDGSRISQGGRSADVLRRYPGGWAIAIDHP